MSILFSTIIALSVVISPITTHSREACHHHSSASSDGVVRTVEDSSTRRSREGRGSQGVGGGAPVAHRNAG